MKKLVTVILLSLVGCTNNCGSACGYEARDSEVVGQVKKVVHATPLVCADHDLADLSLGVMRGGVGSYSTEDMWLVVTPEQVKQLGAMQRANAVVRVTYDTRRASWCTGYDKFARSAEDVSDAGTP